MDIPTQLGARNAVPCTSGVTRRHDKCTIVGLGWSPSRFESLRCRYTGEGGSYQSTGIVGGVTDASQLPGCSTRMQHSGADGQLYGCSILEQAGRHKVANPLLAHPAVTAVVSTVSHNHQSDPHSGGDKPPGRRSFSGEKIRSDGMVSCTAGCSNSLRQDVSSGDRSVRIQVQQTAPRLLHKDGRSSGVRSRRNVARLVRNDGVCISTNLPATPGGGQDKQGGVQRHSNSALLAKTSLVQGASRPTGRASAPSTTVTRSSPDAGRSRRKASDRAPPVDCVAIIRQRCQEKGFSKRAATLIAAGRRESTLRTYGKRLAPYAQWCHAREVSPSRASVADVAEFSPTVLKRV